MLNVPAAAVSSSSATRAQPWPAALPEQVRAVAQMLAGAAAAPALQALQARFKGRGPWKKSLPRILQRWRRWAAGDGWRGCP